METQRGSSGAGRARESWEGATRPDAPQQTGTTQTGAAPSTGTPAPSRGVMDQAREGALRGLDSQRVRAAEGLGVFADALRRGGRELTGEHSTMASYVDAAANQMTRAVDTLRDRDLRHIASDLESFARQRPMLFVGSAFALGLAAARFLKSSEPPPPRARMPMRRDMSPVSQRTTTVAPTPESVKTVTPGQPPAGTVASPPIPRE